MIRPKRNLHRWMWVLLLPAILILFALALSVREPMPVMEVVPAVEGETP